MAENIIVMGCYEAEEFECSEPWAAISIMTEDDWPIISEENRLDLLQLSFGDVTTTLPGYILFSFSHAYDIIDFVEDIWNKIDTLLIHCEMGRSRSAAVAAAIAKIKFGYNDEWFDDPYVPNGRVYNTLLEAFSSRNYKL